MIYQDFHIRVLSKNDAGYKVSVESPQGSASAHIKLPFDVKDTVKKLQQLGGAVRGGAMREAQFVGDDTLSPAAFGSALFQALFSGGVGTMYNRCYSALADPNAGLRIKLHLNLDDPDVSALAQLPWEFVYESQSMEYLSLSRQTPIVRYIEVPRSSSRHVLKGKLRILVVMSSPNGVHKLDLGKERRLIEETWAGDGNVEVDFLEHPTPDMLLQTLVDEQYHVLHYMGHGAYDATTGAGALVLEDRKGDAVMLDAQTLATWLRDAPSVRLVFLNACDTARADRDEPFAGVASRLVMAGVPAVLAMQFPISDEAAIDFARTVYRRLVEGFPIDEATAQGRKAILAGKSRSMEWGTPVLYMRMPDGQLFDAVEVGPRQAPQNVDTHPRSAQPEAPAPAAVHSAVAPRPLVATANRGSGLKIAIGTVGAIAAAAAGYFFILPWVDAARIAPEREQEAEAARNALFLQQTVPSTERIAAEREQQAEAEGITAERAQQAEAARIAAEPPQQAEAARIAAERAQQAEAARIAAERQQQAEAARIAAERQQQAEAARIAAERQQQAEAARIAAERQEQEALAAFVADPLAFWIGGGIVIRLTTQFVEADGLCLESNGPPAGTVRQIDALEGGSFMASCGEALGQAWRIAPAGNGYYHLRSIYGGEGLCLEGNKPVAGASMGGAAFMAPCGNFTGQLWTFKNQSNGYYRLQPYAGEQTNECLEGNQPSNSYLQGRAYMTACGNFSGQLWRPRVF